MTTFLVTSGTAPKTLSHLTQEPTQLYLSAYAPEEGLFRKVCRPKIEGAWRCFNESLESLGSFKCPTTLRLTLVRHLNMADPEGYARLVERASPTYVEAKGYVYVGMSRRRLEFENMPSHNEIKAFAQKLAELTGYNLVGEAEESRVVLLSTLERPMKVA